MPKSELSEAQRKKMDELSYDEKMQIAKETVKMLNGIRAMEAFTDIPPLTEEQENERDLMFFYAACFEAADARRAGRAALKQGCRAMSEAGKRLIAAAKEAQAMTDTPEDLRDYKVTVVFVVPARTMEEAESAVIILLDGIYGVNYSIKALEPTP